MNMVQGKLETEGKTTDFFTEFGITKKVVDFKLDTTSTEIMEKCEEITSHISDNIFGDIFTGIRILVDGQFWKKLVKHAKVTKAYDRWNQGEYLRNGAGLNEFTFGQVTFVRMNYLGYKNTAGQAETFLAAGKGNAVPIGTQNVFEGVYCPANMVQYANTIGQRLYVSREDLKHGQGVEIHMQSRPIAVCKNPKVLVEVVDNA